MRSTTSPLLSGLMYCGRHVGDDGDTRMHRATIQGRPGYSCPTCHQVISKFEHHVIDEFLRVAGDSVLWSVVEEIHEGVAAQLPEIEHRLAELAEQLQTTDDDDLAERITGEMQSLRRARREARAADPVVTLRERGPVKPFRDAWADAHEPADQRAVLGHAIDRIWVIPGRPGRASREAVLRRLVFEWNAGLRGVEPDA